jgi:hypothetical protein
VLRAGAMGAHDGKFIERCGLAPLLIVLPFIESALAKEFDRLAGTGGFEKFEAGGFDAPMQPGKLQRRALGLKADVPGRRGLPADAGQIARGKVIALGGLLARDRLLAGADLRFEREPLRLERGDGALLDILDLLAMLENGLKCKSEAGHGWLSWLPGTGRRCGWLVCDPK